MTSNKQVSRKFMPLICFAFFFSFKELPKGSRSLFPSCSLPADFAMLPAAKRQYNTTFCLQGSPFLVCVAYHFCGSVNRAQGIFVEPLVLPSTEGPPQMETIGPRLPGLSN